MKAAKKPKKVKCEIRGCKQQGITNGMCRLHYLAKWKENQAEKKARAERRLNAYVDRLAQRYPDDYDGIYSGCPAINWASMVPGTFWPQVVMNEAKNFVSKAKLDAATAAVIAACDAADGVTDGVIDDPIRCTWDPQALVGTKIGEDKFVAAANGPNGGIMTQQQAVARKAELMADTFWRDRYLAGGSAEVREMTNLVTIIAGGDDTQESFARMGR